MSERLGDAPVEPQYVKKMNDLASVIDVLFNGLEGERKTGFVLLVFPLDSSEGRCNYISNAQKADVIIMMKEQIARFEGQPEVTGRA